MVSNCLNFNERYGLQQKDTTKCRPSESAVVLGLRYCLLQILNKHIHSFVFWYKTIDSHNIQKFHTTDHAPMRKPNFCSKLVVCECEL